MIFTEKQREFWKNANHRWNIKEGATRSGKTYLDYFLIPRRIKACKGDGLIVLIGNTKGTLSRNILEPMREIWGEENVGRIRGDSTVDLFGKRCHILGADRETAVSKLQGAGIEYCYGDEITTWNRQVFEMLKSRLDKPDSCFDGTCNPASPSHWLLKFLESDADIYRQHYTIYDNPNLTPEFVENLEREYRGTVYFDRFILGKWVMAEGLVYPMFSENNIFSEDVENGDWYISVDYGTLNPFSMGLWRVDGGTAYRVREYYYDGRGSSSLKTDEEYYMELEKLAGDREIVSVVCDPSCASFIEVIRRHGRFSVRKAKNDVLDGIRTTSGYLSAGKIKIHKSCGGIIKEFGVYSWDTDSCTDKPIKENDHAMDDLRYFCYTILRRLWR